MRAVSLSLCFCARAFVFPAPERMVAPAEPLNFGTIKRVQYFGGCIYLPVYFFGGMSSKGLLFA